MVNFHVGQRVVCVDDTNTYKEWASMRGVAYPVKGQVYTIRAIWSDHEGVGLWLEEIVNPDCFWEKYGFVEPSFLIHRFRPLVTTNIDIFLKMLAPSPKEKAKV